MPPRRRFIGDKGLAWAEDYRSLLPPSYHAASITAMREPPAGGRFGLLARPKVFSAADGNRLTSHRLVKWLTTAVMNAAWPRCYLPALILTGSRRGMKYDMHFLVASRLRVIPCAEPDMFRRIPMITRAYELRRNTFCIESLMYRSSAIAQSNRFSWRHVPEDYLSLLGHHNKVHHQKY